MVKVDGARPRVRRELYSPFLAYGFRIVMLVGSRVSLRLLWDIGTGSVHDAGFKHSTEGLRTQGIGREDWGF